MPRRVQDIVPNNHRSIRDIPIERNTIHAPVEPPRRRSSRTSPDTDIKHQNSTHKESVSEISEKRASFVPPPQNNKPRRSRKIFFISIILIVMVTGMAYVASAYFSHATFTISPKTIPIEVNSTYVAQNTTESSLKYDLAVVKGSASVTVPAIDGPEISTSAKGKITIYNNYSSQPQRLIAGTRFADSSGHIYRLTSSITIPGYTGSSDSPIPGKTVAEVTADKPGQEYNISKNTFSENLSIVAYKGTPRYGVMYGQLNTDIMGGFVGTKKTVAEGTLASSTQELRSKITADLLAQIASTMPEGYIMYSDGYIVEFSPATVDGSDPKSANVKMSGTMYGIIFSQNELVDRIAGKETTSAFEEFGYSTPNLESLDFVISNQKDFSPQKENTLIFKLTGKLNLVGSIPIQELKIKLSGLSLQDTTAILKLYKPVIDIEKSSGRVTPPWSKVPSNIERITVDVLTK